MKKKSRNIIMICLGIVFISVIIPIIINYLMYLPIQTNNSTDSDWLSFWGSFLGGIIGGIGGLLGVKLTLNKMEKDKKDEEAKKRPHLIPLEKVFVIYDPKDSEKQMLYADCGQYIYEKDWGRHFQNILEYKTNESIYIDIINVAEESAISVKSVWKDCSKKEEHDKRNVQVIGRDNSGKIKLPFIFRNKIEKIIRENYDKILINKLEDTFNIGQLSIKCKNSKGENLKREYDVFVEISTKIIYYATYDRGIFFINIFFKENIGIQG